MQNATKKVGKRGEKHGDTEGRTWQLLLTSLAVRLSERLNVSPEDAFDIFYESDTCRRFHDPATGLYLFSDLYVVDEVMRELQEKQG